MDCGFIKALSSLFDVFFLCFFPLFVITQMSISCGLIKENVFLKKLGVFIDLINEEQEFETMFDKSSLNMLKNLKPL